MTVVNLTENIRQGGARNIGVETATGDYIQYLDADDTLVEGSLSQLLDAVSINQHLDLLFFDFLTLEENTYRQISGINYSRNTTTILSGEEYLKTQQVPWTPWMALYKRSFLLQNNIKFAEKVRFEDADYVLKSVLLAKNVKYIPIPVVSYVVSGQSTTNIGSDAVKVAERMLSADRLYALIQEYGETHKTGTDIIKGHYQFKYHSILLRNLWRLKYKTIIRLLNLYPYRLEPCTDSLIKFADNYPKIYAMCGLLFAPVLKFLIYVRSEIKR